MLRTTVRDGGNAEVSRVSWETTHLYCALIYPPSRRPRFDPGPAYWGGMNPTDSANWARRRRFVRFTLCGPESMAFVRSLSVTPARCVSALLHWP